jgi:integrase
VTVPNFRYQWEPRTIHDLRRSYGTLMARHVPIHELKSLMGHSSIRTTERHYLAVGDDLGERVRAAFVA